MDFKTKLLRYFIMVAEEGSITRAAQRLNVAQPSLSSRLRALEEFLGFPLLTRVNGRVKLSDEGVTFLPEAKALVAEAERLAALAKNLRRGLLGRIRIGGSYFSLDRPEWRALLEGFSIEYPTTEILITNEFYTSTLLARMRDGDMDLAFTMGPIPEGEFEHLDILKVELQLWLPREAALAQRQAVQLADLDGMSICWHRRESNPHVYDAVAPVLVGAGALLVSPPDTHIGARMRYAEKNGLATLALKGMEPRSETMVLRPIEGLSAQVEWSLTRPRANNCRSAEIFWDFVSRSLEALRIGDVCSITEMEKPPA